MSLDYGKLNFATSFSPTSAFPLDARCYFESYEAALAAAQSAKIAGDTTTAYYYGQTLAVVKGLEGDSPSADLYIIKPIKQMDGTIQGSLLPIASGSDSNAMIYIGTEEPTNEDVNLWINPDEDTNIADIGFPTGGRDGQFLVKDGNEEGVVKWVTITNGNEVEY